MHNTSFLLHSLKLSISESLSHFQTWGEGNTKCLPKKNLSTNITETKQSSRYSEYLLLYCILKLLHCPIQLSDLRLTISSSIQSRSARDKPDSFRTGIWTALHSVRVNGIKKITTLLIPDIPILGMFENVHVSKIADLHAYNHTTCLHQLFVFLDYFWKIAF